MTNSFATTSIICKESLAILENMLAFTACVNRDVDKEFTGNMARGYAPGVTVNMKKPPRYTYRAGRVAVPQATVQQTIPITLTQGGTDLNFTSSERTLSIAQMEPLLKAAMATVANEVDRQGMDMAINSCANAIASPAGLGTYPDTAARALQFFTDCGTRLDQLGAPRNDGNRFAVISPKLNGASIQGLSGLFNSQAALSEQYKSGLMVPAVGFDIRLDQNVQNHTNGTQVAGATTVTTAGQSGSAITVNAIAGTITRGSKVTFALTNAVNPQSRQSTGTLAQFTVTADCAAGATSIPISPPLTPSGQFQNVANSPAAGAVMTILGAASSTWEGSMAFHRDAFMFASVPMYAPPGNRGVVSVAQETYRNVTMKVVEFYDGVNDNYIMRFDILFGWAAPYPELAAAMAV